MTRTGSPPPHWACTESARPGAAPTTNQLALLSEAAGRLSGQRTGLRARVLSAMAGDLFHSWEPSRIERASGAAEEAVALARDLAEPTVLIAALLAHHDARWLPGTASARLPITDELLQLAATTEDRGAEAIARLLRATALIELGDPRGRSDLACYCDLAAELGHSRGRWSAAARSATAALLAGRVDEAAELCAEAARYGVRIGEPDARNVAACQNWDIDRFTGRRRDRLPGSGFAPQVAAWPVWRAIAHAEAGDDAAAAAAMAGIDIDQSWDPGTRIGPDPWGLAVMAEAVAAGGTFEHRQHLYEALLPLTGTHIVAGGLATYAGPADHYLGVLAAALDRPDTAATHHRAAHTAAQRLGAAGWVALCVRYLDTSPPQPDTGRFASRTASGRWPGRAPSSAYPTPRDSTTSPPSSPAQANRSTPSSSLRLTAHDGTDAVLDPAAIAAYRARLRDLETDLAEAEARSRPAPRRTRPRRTRRAAARTEPRRRTRRSTPQARQRG